MKTQKYSLVVAALVGLGSLSPVFAAESGTIHTPNNDAYTTAPSKDASPAPKSSAHKKKQAHKSSVHTTDTTIPADPMSAQGSPNTPTKDSVAPGISGSNIGNDAGKANRGSGDHVPGTTGTSGQ